jgi:hypothetical protein
VYDGCHNQLLEKNSFKFNFVDYGLVTISLGAKGTFEVVAEKTKMSKDECELLTTKLG